MSSGKHRVALASRSLIFLLCVTAWFGLCVRSTAQDIVTGAIEGIVADRVSEAPIKHASVRIVNDGSKSEVVVRTDSKGRFFQGLLPPGTYTLHFSAPGYFSRQAPHRLFANRVSEFVPLPLFLDPEKGQPNQARFSGGIAVASLPSALVEVKSLEEGSVFKRLIPANERLCVFDNLPSRLYRVSSTLEGYQRVTKEVLVTNQTVPVTLDLLPNESTVQLAAITGRFHALVIGNNDYQYLNKLRTAENDAKAIEATLKRHYAFETRLLLNATREQILVALNEYRRKLEHNENLLIYYAGHGHNDSEVDKAYWLPVDAREENNANWISADDITINVKGIKAKHILIVSDSCYSGTIIRGARLAMNDEMLGRDRYLLKMVGGRSRTLMASGGNEPVADKGPSGHSIFANAFLTGLRQMDREIFTAEELYYNFVREVVSGRSDQTPQYDSLRNSGHEGGDFLFLRKMR